MRRPLPWLLTILCPLCLACGGGADTTTSSAGGVGTTSGTGGMMAGSIPLAGTSDQVDNDFTDVEPNDTPEQATPLGVAMSGDIDVWVGGNTIGGSANPADYFVFKSGPTAGKFTFDICSTPPTTGIAATLWKVVGGQEQTPPVGTWTSSACVTTGTMGAALEASTEYLFGLTATGGAGMYSA